MECTTDDSECGRRSRERPVWRYEKERAAQEEELRLTRSSVQEALVARGEQVELAISLRAAESSLEELRSAGAFRCAERLGDVFWLFWIQGVLPGALLVF